MKTKYEYDLNADLTIIGLVYIMIIFGSLYIGTLYKTYKLENELFQSKVIAVQLYNESKYTDYVIQDLNDKLNQKRTELKEFNDLKQLKEDVREFWERR